MIRSSSSFTTHEDMGKRIFMSSWAFYKKQIWKTHNHSRFTRRVHIQRLKTWIYFMWTPIDMTLDSLFISWNTRLQKIIGTQGTRELYITFWLWVILLRHISADVFLSVALLFLRWRRWMSLQEYDWAQLRGPALPGLICLEIDTLWRCIIFIWSSAISIFPSLFSKELCFCPRQDKTAPAMVLDLPFPHRQCIRTDLPMQISFEMKEESMKRESRDGMLISLMGTCTNFIPLEPTWSS